jgi:hypothetical protein
MSGGGLDPALLTDLGQRGIIEPYHRKNHLRRVGNIQTKNESGRRILTLSPLGDIPAETPRLARQCRRSATRA